MAASTIRSRAAEASTRCASTSAIPAAARRRGRCRAVPLPPRSTTWRSAGRRCPDAGGGAPRHALARRRGPRRARCASPRPPDQRRADLPRRSRPAQHRVQRRQDRPAPRGRAGRVACDLARSVIARAASRADRYPARRCRGFSRPAAVRRRRRRGSDAARRGGEREHRRREIRAHPGGRRRDGPGAGGGASGDRFRAARRAPHRPPRAADAHGAAGSDRRGDPRRPGARGGDRDRGRHASGSAVAGRALGADSLARRGERARSGGAGTLSRALADPRGCTGRGPYRLLLTPPPTLEDAAEVTVTAEARRPGERPSASVRLPLVPVARQDEVPRKLPGRGGAVAIRSGWFGDGHGLQAPLIGVEGALRKPWRAMQLALVVDLWWARARQTTALSSTLMDTRDDFLVASIAGSLRLPVSDATAIWAQAGAGMVGASARVGVSGQTRGDATSRGVVPAVEIGLGAERRMWGGVPFLEARLLRTRSFALPNLVGALTAFTICA